MATRSSRRARQPAAKPTARSRRPPGKRAANKEALRDRITLAALDLFQSKGFDATTTKQIARKARVAEGTIFNYFPTKEDIALHFFAMEVDHAIARVRANARLRRATLEEKLFALVQYQLEYLAPYERFIGAAFVQALRPTSRLGFSAQALDLRNRYLSFVDELMQESLGPTRGTIFTWFAPLVFWVLYLGLLLYWLNDDSARKQNTLALLDRSLQGGVAILRKGAL